MVYRKEVASMGAAKKIDDNDQDKDIKKYRRKSPRAVIEIEARLPNEEIVRILGIAEKLRKIANETRGEMRKRLEQLTRRKRYKKLVGLYWKAKERLGKNPEDSASAKAVNEYSEALSAMRKEAKLSLYECYTVANSIRKKYDGVNASFAYSIGDAVWASVSAVLFGDGEKLHFAKRGELPSLRGRMRDRDIIIGLKENGRIEVFFGKTEIKLGHCDDYQSRTLAEIAKYLNDAEATDRAAAELYKNTGGIVDTYRPCYAALVPKEIRGRWRIFLQVTYEGTPLQTKRPKGKGVIGIDIGTQTIAYTSDTEVGLKNLAERGNSIEKNEHEAWLIQRAMDRSLRAMNPENYNSDGTVKKGWKRWRKSKNYLKLQKKYRELSRKAAINRHLAINEEANRLRTLGDTIITEPQNYAALMKKAKKPEDGSVKKTKSGKCAKRKRFGRSVKNRCPGYFHSHTRSVFERTGGLFIEVDSKRYRASQYDHTDGQYKKKSLSTRMYNLASGDCVQRDWYSSFLLYNYDFDTCDIDKAMCKENFAQFFLKQNNMIESIISNKIRVLNSGVKIVK